MMQNKNAESTKEKEAVQMEKAKVYYTDFRAKLGEGLPTKLQRLMKKAGISEIDMENKFVAIKMHFGELGNLSFLRPNYAKAVADVVKELGGKPFLTDCNTLYPGSRKKCAGTLVLCMGKRIYPDDGWVSDPDRRRSERNR